MLHLATFVFIPIAIGIDYLQILRCAAPRRFYFDVGFLQMLRCAAPRCFYIRRRIILTKKVQSTIIFVTINIAQCDNQGAAHRNILIKIDSMSLPCEIQHRLCHQLEADDTSPGKLIDGLISIHDLPSSKIYNSSFKI